MSHRNLAQIAGSVLFLATAWSPTPSWSNPDSIVTMGDWRDASKEDQMRFVAELATKARKTNYFVSEPSIYKCLNQGAYFYKREVPIAHVTELCSKDD